MELHQFYPVLILVFNTYKGSAILPIPQLHFEEKVIEDLDTKITCTIDTTDCVEVNLEIKGNETLENCEPETRRNLSDKVVRTSKVCTVEVTIEMDQMEFICEVSFKTKSKPEKMPIQKDPNITDCPDKLVWREGEETSFHCEAIGYPFPNVTCQKGDAIYRAGQKFRILRDMTGDYTCTARNFDKITKAIHVSVQYKSKVLNITVDPPLRNEGDRVTITCEAEGVPAPNYIWRTPSSDVQFSPDNKTVTIQKITRSHLGKYECTASNMHGSHNLEQELRLAVKPQISVLEAEPSTEVLKGDNVTLSCKATGIPTPDLTWNLPKPEVDVSKDKRTVKIFGMTEEHEGNYSCTAHNKYGNATMSTQIKLGVKPKVLSIKVQPPTDVSENDNLTLLCVAHGVPHPTYSWQPLTPNVILSHDNSTINIMAIQKGQSGKYSCTAQNKHGRDTMTKRITVKGKSNSGDRTEMRKITILTVVISTCLILYVF